MHIIYGHRHTKKGVRIDFAHMRKAGDKADRLTFIQPTKNGWLSKAAILADFPFTCTREGYQTEVLQISDEVAEMLIGRYDNVKVKVYQSAKDKATASAVDMCDYLQPDTIGSNG